MMLRTLKYTILSAFLSLTFIASVQAQKYGHLNSTALMADLPAIKSVDAQLVTFQEQLAKQGEDMMKKFQTNYEAYLAKSNAGEITPLQAQETEASLTQEQTAIQTFQAEAQSKVLAKREELYKPIFDKVRDIIAEYGKNNNYTMIFDSGMGGILFQDSEDITDKIKALVQ